MTSNLHSIDKYTFSNSDHCLIDANVWLYIYGPQFDPNDWRAGKYSKALGSMLQAGTAIYIDVLILSEFVNRYLRLKHNLLVTQRALVSSHFKSFRQSPSYSSVASEITDAVKRIIKSAKRINNGFETMNFNQLLHAFEKEHRDLNDEVLVQLCQEKNWKLVTHDADFKNSSGITVITANPRLTPYRC